MRGVNIKSLKKRNRNFKISLIVCLILTVIFSYVVFNFRSVFGVGIFNAEDDYINSYSDGTAGVNLHMRLEHHEDGKYYLYTFINPISTGNVANYGILSISAVYENNGGIIYVSGPIDFAIPYSSYTMQRLYLSVAKHNNITCHGTIELNVETGGIPINDTINFQLSYILPWGIEDYHNIDLILYTLFFFPFFLPIIFPIVLNWIYRPKFGLNYYSEEDEKRDELYLKYLHEHIKEQREKAIK